MNFEKRLSLSLFTLRLGVFIVMAMWTIDKFVNPEHATRIFENFYLIKGFSTGLVYTVGAIQLAVVVSFFVGFKKKWTYGFIFLLHAVSTLSSWHVYLNPWGPRNLLFFAAWPMLAAIFALYLLREKDTLFTVGE